MQKSGNDSARCLKQQKFAIYIGKSFEVIIDLFAVGGTIEKVLKKSTHLKCL